MSWLGTRICHSASVLSSSFFVLAALGCSGTIASHPSGQSGTAQTINFAAVGTQTVGTPLTLVATASSGLPVSFASQTTGACTVNGTTATFLTAGTCTIQATQAGNTAYAAATPVSQSFAVTSASGSLLPQTITFNDPGSQVVSSAEPALAVGTTRRSVRPRSP